MIKKYLPRADPFREASSFDPSYRQQLPPTMATPPDPPNLVTPTNSYHDYFTRVKTNTFRGCYAAVLAPYVALMIYAASQEGVPIAFLQCNQGASGRGA